jgi:hypothetical protein
MSQKAFGGDLVSRHDVPPSTEIGGRLWYRGIGLRAFETEQELQGHHDKIEEDSKAYGEHGARGGGRHALETDPWHAGHHDKIEEDSKAYCDMEPAGAGRESGRSIRKLDGARREDGHRDKIEENSKAYGNVGSRDFETNTERDGDHGEDGLHDKIEENSKAYGDHGDHGDHYPRLLPREGYIENKPGPWSPWSPWSPDKNGRFICPRGHDPPRPECGHCGPAFPVD